MSEPITDYEAAALIELVFQKTVAFDQISTLDLGTGSERLLLAVGIALKDVPANAHTHVLDFGGACGIHYKFATLLFPESTFRWAIVETSAMVRRARSLETESLNFFKDIASAMTWLERVDLVNSNSALQYVENPLATVQDLLAQRPNVVLWERLMLSDRETYSDQQRSMLFDHGPGAAPSGFRNRPVRQTIIRLSRADFLDSHKEAFVQRCAAEGAGHLSTFLFSRRKHHGASSLDVARAD